MEGCGEVLSCTETLGKTVIAQPQRKRGYIKTGVGLILPSKKTMTTAYKKNTSCGI